MVEDKKTVNFGQAIVIPGEAPETDDEDEDTETINSALGNQSTNADAGTSTPRRNSMPSSPSKYDSLLQRKLRESHQNFSRHVSEYCFKTADNLNKDVKKISANIGTAQTAVQDAACSIRSVADVLYKVEENLDVIFSCQFLPELENSKFPNINKYRNITQK